MRGMRGAMAALSVEWLKMRKSRMIWITSAIFVFAPLMMGVLMFIVKHPELAGRMGLMSAKANQIGEADWPTMFSLLDQLFSVGGVVGFGFITSWVFGREYADRTIKDLLALPVSRTTIILAKFAVVFLWCFVLAILLFLSGVSVGLLVGLDGWSADAVLSKFLRVEAASLLLLILCAPVAYFANYGRGYMLPMGMIFLVIVMAQFIGVLGLAPYFPWAIPALFLGAAGPEHEQLSMVSYVILLLTSGAGFYGTHYWWNRVDQT